MDTSCLKYQGHCLKDTKTQTVWKTKDTNSLKDKLFERPRMQTVWNRESQAEETKVYRDYSRHLPQLLLWIGIFDLWAVDNVGLSRLDLAHWRVGYITNSGPIIKCLWLISVVWHWKGHYGAKGLSRFGIQYMYVKIFKKKGWEVGQGNLHFLSFE